MKPLLTAAAVLLAAGAFMPMAQAQTFEGPRPSSLENWHGMTSNAPATKVANNTTSPTFDGPRPASYGNWSRMMNASATSTDTGAAPHYVWRGTYTPPGQWHGHWALVR